MKNSPEVCSSFINSAGEFEGTRGRSPAGKTALYQTQNIDVIEFESLWRRGRSSTARRRRVSCFQIDRSTGLLEIFQVLYKFLQGVAFRFSAATRGRNCASRSKYFRSSAATAEPISKTSANSSNTSAAAQTMSFLSQLVNELDEFPCVAGRSPKTAASPCADCSVSQSDAPLLFAVRSARRTRSESVAAPRRHGQHNARKRHRPRG